MIKSTKTKLVSVEQEIANVRVVYRAASASLIQHLEWQNAITSQIEATRCLKEDLRRELARLRRAKYR